jgi:spore coat protein H
VRATKSATCGSWRSRWLFGLLASLAIQFPVLSSEADSGREAGRTAADQLFSGTNVLAIRIEVSKEGMAALAKAHLQNPERPVAQCEVREGNSIYTNVAVHLKGAAGSFRTLDQKPGLTLNFGKSVPGQRFHGLAKISLNNSVQDPAYVSEKLCREMYNAADVPVPRASYAQVTLNGRSLGLYVLTEGWNKEFLKRYFKKAKGNFYDPGLAKDIDVSSTPNFGENPDDNSGIKALIAATKETNLTQRLGKLEKALDLDRFITLIALDALTWNWDGYALDKNNYRVYHDLEKGRMVFFPHGMDQMFWRPEAPLMPGMRGLVASAAIEIPEVRQRYLERISNLMATVFQMPKMTNRVRELGEIVLPALRASGNSSAADEYQDNLQLVQERIVARASVVSKQFNQLKYLLKFDGTTPQKIEPWSLVSKIGKPIQPRSAGEALLEIGGKEAPDKLWGALVVLEGGIYRVEGRVKVEGVPIKEEEDAPGEPPRMQGAGFRVWSRRKFSEGLDWQWFPYFESRNFKKRGLLPPRSGTGKGLSGTSDWTTVAYEFELRQPMADLTIFFELRETAGKAVLNPESMRITRLAR